MNSRELARERIPLLEAFASGKDLEFQSDTIPAWRRFDPSRSGPALHAPDLRWRIAKERQPLGHIQEGGTYGDSHEVSIDSDGLHVGCTTISFERVREIALACRKWQNDGKKAPARREFWLGLHRNSDYSCVQAVKCSQDFKPDDCTADDVIKVREVLPGEEEI